MSKIKPFKALIPNPVHVGRIISPPYDVIDVEGARCFAEGNPYSFLHITRAEIDLPTDVASYDNAVYKKAAANLEMFQKNGVLIRDGESLYIYRQVMNGHAQTGLRHVEAATAAQTGIVALASVDEYASGRIKRHELTREEKVVDRAWHADAIKAHAEPVFLVHKESGEMSCLILQETMEKPLYDVVGWDGVRHIFWRVKRAVPIISAFEKFDALYIADGHHRSASAARVRELHQRNNPNHNGSEDYNFFPVVIFSEDEVRIFEYKWDGDPLKRPLSDKNWRESGSLASLRS